MPLHRGRVRDVEHGFVAHILFPPNIQSISLLHLLNRQRWRKRLLPHLACAPEAAAAAEWSVARRFRVLIGICLLKLALQQILPFD